jgi:thiol-disulfide isomerase/thioredoxin
MRIRVAFLAALVAVLAGCSSGAGPSAAPDTPAKEAASGAPAAAVPATLAFTGKTVDGQPFDGARLAGRPVVLWFWAPWCGTCAGQAASVADAHDRYDGRVSVVGVAGLGELKAMKEFVKDLDIGSVPHVDDQAGAIWRKFAITQQSEYVFIDAGGAIVHRGWLDSVAFDERIADLAG